jgi:hypothetical protein
VRYIFTSDDEPRREERADLGEGLRFVSYSNKLKPSQQNEDTTSWTPLQMYQKDHFEIANQQNKLARTIRLVMVLGFLMIVAEIIAISQTSSLTARIAIGGAGALGAGLVYYIRSTFMPSNQHLLTQRKEIRESATEAYQREQEIEILRPFLRSNPDVFLAAFRNLDSSGQPED